jgi:hypothetical protein
LSPSKAHGWTRAVLRQAWQTPIAVEDIAKGRPSEGKFWCSRREVKEAWRAVASAASAAVR